MDRFATSFALRCAVAALAAAALAVAALAQQKPAGAPRAEDGTPPTLEELRAMLREREPAARRRAVQGLARLATRDAWLAVIGALADPESAVADEAQLALGGVADAELAGDLCGRLGLDSREEVVARRVAEALGRMQVSIDGEALARALDPRDEERSRMAAWSIERAAAGGRLAGRADRIARELSGLAQSRRAGEASCAALVALANVDRIAAQAAASAAVGDRDPSRRCAGLVAARRAGMAEGRAWAIRALSDSETRVRACAIDELLDDGSRPALAALVEQLGKDARIRLRWRIVDHLQRASGLKHRLDPRAWRVWVDSLPDSGAPRRPAARPGDKTETGGGASRATGITFPLFSDRACFLFDFSGSMWTPLADGRLPKDVVAAALRATFERLEPTMSVNVVPFTYDPLPWERELQPATPANVKRALEFFDDCQAKGRGNYFDAALFALADPDVDTIVALTDGVPTGGTHSDVDLVVELLVERNRFRRVAFDSILVDAPPGIARRWRDLAVRTGGRCVEVEREAR
jgi:hypothetical protein